MFDWLHKNSVVVTNSQNLTVECAPQIAESSSNLKLTVRATQNREIVPCQFNWYKISNSIITKISHKKGNAYMCGPDDVGCIIKVEITSLDQEFPGFAYAEFGPIRIDLLIRKSVQKCLNNGYGDFPIFVIFGNEERQCNFRLLNNGLIIRETVNDVKINCQYPLGTIVEDPEGNSVTKISIRLEEKQKSIIKDFLIQIFEKDENFELLQLRFINRISRDMFLFTFKGFQTYKSLKNSVIMKSLQTVALRQQTSFNYINEIDRLKADIDQLLNQYRKCNNEKEIILKENIRLEEQIQILKSSPAKHNESRAKRSRIFDRAENKNSSFKSPESVENLLINLNQREVQAFEKLNISAIYQESVKMEQSKKAQTEDMELRMASLSQQVSDLKRTNQLMLGDIFVLQRYLEESVQKNRKLEEQLIKVNQGKNQLIQQVQTIEQENMKVRNCNVEIKSIEPLEIERAKNEINELKREIEKISKKYIEVARQNKYLKKNTEFVNKSLELSYQMDSYFQQERNTLKQQNELLLEQNAKLTKLCEKYLTEAKQVAKLKNQLFMAKHHHNDKLILQQP